MFTKDEPLVSSGVMSPTLECYELKLNHSHGLRLEMEMLGGTTRHPPKSGTSKYSFGMVDTHRSNRENPPFYAENHAFVDSNYTFRPNSNAV